MGEGGWTWKEGGGVVGVSVAVVADGAWVGEGEGRWDWEGGW